MRYVEHKDICKNKWDELIISVSHTQFCFLFDFLTSICKWDAIILEEQGKYVMVLPVPFKKKLWVKYFYQPFFVQQLGVISSTKVTQKHQLSVVSLLKRRFNFGQMNWNMKFDIHTQDIHFITKTNYVLPLELSYEEQLKKLNKNRQRIIKKLGREDFVTKVCYENQDFEEVILRFAKLFEIKIPEVTQFHYRTVINALNKIYDQLEIIAVKVQRGGLTASGSLFINMNGRLVYLLGYTEDEFKSQSVHILSFTRIMELFNTSEVVLDLEGGEDAGIGGFYRSLGADKEHYYQVRLKPRNFLFRKIFR